jgi:hypothetical protein
MKVLILVNDSDTDRSFEDMDFLDSNVLTKEIDIIK